MRSDEPIVSVKEESLHSLAADAQKSETRDLLRKEVLSLRAQLPRPYRLHKSSVICDELEQALELSCAMLDIDPDECIIAVYSAFNEEVQLDQFIRAAYEKGVRVAFPCIVTDAWSVDESLPQTMEMRIVSKEAYDSKRVPFLANPLKKYTHHDKELEDFPYVSAESITMIVIPLVAFDAQHNRLGYGGGNYDRYLPQLDDACRQIGVAFAEQEVPFIPTEPYDVAVNVLAR
jgi:5-formyltetrahydrofolate cyclo-ligase